VSRHGRLYRNKLGSEAAREDFCPETIANDNNGGAGKNSVAITQRYYKLYHARSMKAINAFRPTASEDSPAG
jgi:hypothetical protein